MGAVALIYKLDPEFHGLVLDPSILAIQYPRGFNLILDCLMSIKSF